MVVATLIVHVQHQAQILVVDPLLKGYWILQNPTFSIQNRTVLVQKPNIAIKKQAFLPVVGKQAFLPELEFDPR